MNLLFWVRNAKRLPSSRTKTCLEQNAVKKLHYKQIAVLPPSDAICPWKILDAPLWAIIQAFVFQPLTVNY